MKKLIATVAIVVLLVQAMPAMAQPEISSPPAGFCEGTKEWFIPASASPQGGDCGQGVYVEQHQGNSQNFGSIAEALGAHANEDRTIWFQPQAEPDPQPEISSPPAGFCEGTKEWFIPASASPQGGDCGQGVYVEQHQGNSQNFGSIAEALGAHANEDRTIWFQPQAEPDPQVPAPQPQQNPQRQPQQPAQPQQQPIAAQPVVQALAATEVDLQFCGGEHMFANAQLGLNIREGAGVSFAKTGSYPYGAAVQLEACFETSDARWRYWVETPRGFVAATLLSKTRPQKVEADAEVDDDEVEDAVEGEGEVEAEAVDTTNEVAEMPEGARALLAPFCSGEISMQAAVLPLAEPCQGGMYYFLDGSVIVLLSDWEAAKDAEGVEKLWFLPQ